MTNRFRMIAGPNGSGKSTLMRLLAEEYAVNFYAVLNADDIFAEVRRTGAYFPPFAVDEAEWRAFAEVSTYGEEIKRHVREGRIYVEDDCLRFVTPEAVNSYTVALVTGFLQDSAIRAGRSFSQETVFSHPSKVAALERAAKGGYRTYLYYVATESPEVNLNRVANRVRQGGHIVPDEKVVARYARSLDQVPAAVPFLSRAYFFDNSCDEMRYLAQWSREGGLDLADDVARLPRWFARLIPAIQAAFEEVVRPGSGGSEGRS